MLQLRLSQAVKEPISIKQKGEDDDQTKCQSTNTIHPPTRMRNLAQITSAPEVKKVKEKLKALLPSLTVAQIRRYNVPSHVATVAELAESDYLDSLKYLEDLFELDEEIRIKAGPGSIIWEKARLKHDNELIAFVTRALCQSEDAKRIKDISGRTMALLNAAIDIQLRTWEWWWIAERFYQSSLEVAKTSRDDKRLITMVRYLYGRFLFHEMDDPKEAVSHLKLARKAAEGKTWNAGDILQVKQETVFRESNILLHKALLILSWQVSREEPEVSTKYCEQALNRAKDSGHNKLIATAMYELGKSYLRGGNAKSALHWFSKLLAMAKRLPDPEGMCNAHMELAFAYKELEDRENIEKHLTALTELATDYELTYKLAQGNYYTGEHFLSQEKPQLATKPLERSFSLYNQLKLKDEADRARCIAGLSKGILSH